MLCNIQRLLDEKQTVSEKSRKIVFHHEYSFSPTHPSTYRADLLNAVYFRQSLTYTLGLTNELIDGGQLRDKAVFETCFDFALRRWGLALGWTPSIKSLLNPKVHIGPC